MWQRLGVVGLLLVPFVLGCGPRDHPGDCRALRAVYNSTRLAATGRRLPWPVDTTGSSLCTWSYVQCADRHGQERVVTLNLKNVQLNGTLPSEIDGLTALETLDVSANELTGNIPSSIGNLTQLTDLVLEMNLFVRSKNKSYLRVTILIIAPFCFLG